MGKQEARWEESINWTDHFASLNHKKKSNANQKESIADEKTPSVNGVLLRPHDDPS